MRVPLVLATLLVFAGIGVARAAEPEPGTISRAPSAKRMVLERQALLVNAFARYLEQQLGFNLLSPVGRTVALELAPVDTDGASAGVVSLRHRFGATEGGNALVPTRMSAALSARADSVKLTFRLRW